jgi:hypothetical protein
VCTFGLFHTISQFAAARQSFAEHTAVSSLTLPLSQALGSLAMGASVP